MASAFCNGINPIPSYTESVRDPRYGIICEIPDT